MQSVWVKWKISALEYSELTIDDILGEVGRAVDKPPCESRGDPHSLDTYIANTKRGPYVLCRQCCKRLGLALPPRRRYQTKQR